MEVIDARVKRWGNSFGIVLPRVIVENEGLKDGSSVEISVRAKNKTKVKDIFGLLKGRLKKDTEEIMKDTDRALWGIKR